MTAGQLVGEDTQPYAPPVDTGEAVGSPVSRLTITLGYGPSLFDHRFGLAAAQAGRAGRAAAAAQREPRPRLHRRRPVRPGLLRRPAGRVPRRAEPGPDRHGRGRAQLDGARLRPHLDHVHRPGHPAQPARLQGRHPQHQGRADRPDERLRVGRRRRPTSPGCAAAATWSPARSGCSSRTGTATTSQDQENVIGRAKVIRRPAVRRHRVHHARLHRRRRQRRSPPSRPTRTSGWPASSTTAGPASCAAATPSPTASTRRPEPCSAGCSSSPS